MLSPILTKVVAANPKVTLIKVNVDEMQDISADYKITALPTVKAFHNSEVVDEFIGMRNAAQCEAFVKKHAERTQ
ncbi:thioredoxin 2 [Apophysomyces ossiformis]|uniref:Thioredoxin 2 n=1 Tax=Apophysomyces ossiformis TaxID=679940 RepID=A0A8H7BRV3_9FUNG|nr:thioredoxin 2 [Apophysomyces ossiformis]